MLRRIRVFPQGRTFMTKIKEGRKEGRKRKKKSSDYVAGDNGRVDGIHGSPTVVMARFKPVRLDHVNRRLGKKTEPFGRNFFFPPFPFFVLFSQQNLLLPFFLFYFRVLFFFVCLFLVSSFLVAVGVLGVCTLKPLPAQGYHEGLDSFWIKSGSLFCDGQACC